MLFKTIHIKRIYIVLLCVFIIILLLCFLFYTTFSNVSSAKGNYIKWVDFSATYKVLEKTANLDISSHTKNDNVKLNWIELISYLACKYGNDFNQFNQKDLDNIIQKLKNGETMDSLTSDLKNYSYYFEAYNTILNQFIGEYKIENKNSPGTFEDKYGIKVFSPIAKNYDFTHYVDFGSSRSYGFNRKHLGNDLFGSIGTPIVAVESGVIESVGWNQYGGWRIGIRSFDKKRYYYYAHLRKNHPYAEDIYEGRIITAGDVIGYLGMTGYSATENVNNINVPHLHFGMQLIFDEVQKEGTNQIWIDVYNIIEFLNKNKSEVFMDNKITSDYERKYQFIDPLVNE